MTVIPVAEKPAPARERLLPRLLPLIRRSAFRARFDDKGRLADYVRGIPAYLILRQHAGLLGAAAALVQEKNNGKGE